MTEEITDDEMFAQIAKNQAGMMAIINSHQAIIKRLEFRIERLERTKGGEHR